MPEQVGGLMCDGIGPVVYDDGFVQSLTWSRTVVVIRKDPVEVEVDRPYPHCLMEEFLSLSRGEVDYLKSVPGSDTSNNGDV